MNKNARHQRGAALLIVLMLMAALSVTAIAITERMNRLVNQSSAVSDRDQAMWILLGAEQFALQFLVAQNALRNDVDTAEDDWLQSQPPIPYRGAIISLQAVDRSACFNLNQLVSTDDDGTLSASRAGVARFSAVLEGLGGDARTGEALAAMVSDFIDSDDQPEPGSAEDFNYTAGPVPYLTARTFLADVTELRAIKNWTSAIYRQLRPFLCVRPGDESFGAINLNTLTVEDAPVLFAALEKKVPVRSLERLIESRPPAGYNNVGEFVSQPALASLNPPISATETERLATFATHIELLIEVAYGDHMFKMSTLIEGAPGGAFRVLSRRLGEDDL